jgi:hypothetical protein
MILDQIKFRFEKNDLIRSEIMLFLIFKNNDLRSLILKDLPRSASNATSNPDQTNWLGTDMYLI